MLSDVYADYERALDAVGRDGRIMPYRWSGLPDTLSFAWLPYRHMFDEFSQGISNGINSLTDYVGRIIAWDAVIAGMDEDQLFEIKHAFIEPVATVALGLPYVIQNRFLFAAAHLCHQANFARDPSSWVDNLRLDEDINLDDANKHGRGWRKYTRFKTRLEKVDSQAYRDDTDDFRNTYTHRFPPGIVLGVTGIVRREETEAGGFRYAIGGRDPLLLRAIADTLKRQCQASYLAFDAFQNLVREHEARIVGFEAGHKEPSA